MNEPYGLTIVSGKEEFGSHALKPGKTFVKLTL